MQSINELVAGNRDRVMVDRLKTIGLLGAGAVAITGAAFARHPLPQTILGAGAVACGLAAERIDRRVRLGGQLMETTDRIALESIARAYQQALSPAQLSQAIALPASEPGPLPMGQWWPDVLGYPTVLVYGQFGSGKTTLAKRLIADRSAAGHRVKVLDPHMAAGAWDGCETVGGGMDYEAIDRALADFASEVENRYRLLAKDKDADFKPITYACDEFTHWADRTKNAADFFAATMADTRKVRMYAVFIGHGRTLQCIGGKAGLAKTRDDSLLEIKLTAKPDPNSPTGVSPTGLGELKYPGNPEPVAIAIERFGALPPAPMPQTIAPAHLDDRQLLTRCWDSAIEVGHETIADEAIEPSASQQELINLLVEISRKNGTVSAADCQRASRKFKAISPDDIRQLFLIAQAVGLGTVDGDGASARFTALTRG
jgi:hypothetical protein